MVWASAGCRITLSLLASHLLVTGAVHLLAALAFTNRAAGRNGRPWALTLLLVPPAMALLPWSGVSIILAAALVWAGAVFGRGQGHPLLASAFGAGLGAGIAAATAGLKAELTPVPMDAAGKTGLGIALAGAAAVLLLTLLRLPVRRLQPRPLPVAAASCGIILLASLLSTPDSRSRFSPTGSGDRPPVVLIVLDTLRADHLKSYGYGRDTMPLLERFAREHAVRVEGAMANASSSLETHGSIFTGLYAVRHGGHKPWTDDPRPPVYAYPLRRDVPTLAGTLRRAGYWTVGISANFGPLSPAFGLGRGFDFYRAEPGTHERAASLNPFFVTWNRRWPLARLDRLPPFAGAEYFEPGVPYRRVSDVVDAGIEVLDRAGDRPLFLFLNLMEPHAPNRPPRSFTAIYPGTRRPGLRPLNDEQAAMGEIMAGRRAPADEDLAAWTAAYDSELRYLDGELARLLDRLRRHPRFDEMLVVVTSDHGEGLGEHGLFRHSTSLYGEMLDVPLFLKPGARRPARFVPGDTIPGPFQPVDLHPTILDHAGLRIPPGLDGAPWAEDRRASFAEGYVHPPAKGWGPRFRVESRAIQAGGWKLILWSDGHRELYDLGRDPGERASLADRHPEIADRLAGAIEAALPRTDGTDGAGERGTESDELTRSLRSLGYVQ